MKTIVYIATSLDGFIAKPDGGLDWLTDIPNPDHDDFGFAEFMHGIDALVMGRNTFEKVLTFDSWPYTKKVFVLSNSLQIVPEKVHNKAELLKGTPKEVLEKLSHMGYNTIYVDGGKTIQGFLEADLIDEMILTRIPIVLGSGIPLFGKLISELNFHHVKTDVLLGSLVKSWYKRIRK